MHKMEIKISNIFKEKKKDNNRINCKQNTKDIYLEENINKNLISLLNKKRKKSNSNDKNLKKIKHNNNNILGNIINIKEDLILNNNKNNFFELSEKTKNILKKIESKKKFDNNNKNSKMINITTNKNISPPKLSKKTIEIINQIQETKNHNFNNKQSNIDKKYNNLNSSYYLHLKYDELISAKRELRLPIKYKELLNTFSQLEQIINLNKIKNQNELNTFNEIKIRIESMTNIKFDINIFKQILYIVPNFYIIKYIKKIDDEYNKNKKYDLIIDIPFDFKKRMDKNYEKDFNFLNINYYKENDENFNPILLKTPLTVANLKKRKEIFRNNLNLIVNNYHSKFLQKNKIKIKFNPLEQKTWYHKFDPDSECEDIPKFTIPNPKEDITMLFNVSRNDNDNKYKEEKDNNVKKNKLIIVL